MIIPYQPQNLSAEQSDGNILLTWAPSLGATSYQIQLSLDGINFTNYAVTPGVYPQFLDILPGVSVMRFYQVAGISNAGAFAVATLTFSGQPNPGDIVTIANVAFIAGTTFAIGGTLAQTIANLVLTINNYPGLKYVVFASSAGSVITVSSVTPGTEGNGLQFTNALTNVVGTGFANGQTPTISPFSSVVQMVAAPPSEMSLFELRLRSQQTADRVYSDFVTTSEWNAFLRIALYELYDLLITVYEDYGVAPYVYINTLSTGVSGSGMVYNLPDGVSNYLGNITGQNAPLTGAPAPAYYKLVGVDLGINTSNNAWVTLNRFDYIDRNAYVYPNSTSTIYGVYNMRYRTMGSNPATIEFIPTPAGNQQIRLTYAPRLTGMLADTDITTIGTSGWLRYVIARAAKYALDKEEGTDTSKLDTEIAFLKLRIEQSASNRDIGQPDTISDTRRDSTYGGNGWGSGGGQGGW